MSKKIIFYISVFILGLGIRLINLNSPLVDAHSWRQTFTAMIAKNFYLNNYRLLYPEIDYNGDRNSFVASEFQIYPFITALFYKLFGFKELFGKMVSISFYFLAAILIYGLYKKYSTENIANWSIIFFMFLPLSVFYSQAFMPESMMLCCSIAVIYYFDKWLEKGKIAFLIISAIFFNLAISIKPFTLYLLVPLSYLSWKKHNGKIIRFDNIIFIIFSLTLPVFWYFYWCKKLDIGLFGTLGFSGDRWGSLRLWINPEWYSRVFLQHLWENWFVFSGGIFLALGLIKSKNIKVHLFHFWLAAIVAYIFVIAGSNYPHEYYQFPIIPPACFFIGSYVSGFFENLKVEKLKWYKNKKSIAVILLLLIMIPISLNKIIYRMKYCRQMQYIDAARAIDSISNKKDLILVADNDQPEVIYYSQRKGWHINPVMKKTEINYIVEELTGNFDRLETIYYNPRKNWHLDYDMKSIIELYKRCGVKYFETTALGVFFNNKDFSQYMQNNYQVIGSKDKNFIIFDLKNAR